MHFPDARILVFAKAPVPGHAKTRLIPALGAQGAAALQARLIHDTLAMAVDSRLAPVELWIGDAPGHLTLCAAPQPFDGPVHPQRGRDLGLRMLHALSRALDGARCAVLIGTDCPDMDGAYLQRALTALEGGADAVLGPAEDGGYVLIGVRRAEPALFRDIDWGTPRVLGQTRARLAALKWRHEELEVRRDLDRPADLERLGLTWLPGVL